MKLVTAVFALATIAFGFQAQAVEAYSTCTNGTFEEMGDGYLQVDIMNDGSLMLLPYEGEYPVKETDYTYESTSRVLTIVNKKLAGSVEGEENTVVVNAIFVPTSNGKVQVAISFNQGEFQTQTLTCKKN